MTQRPYVPPVSLAETSVPRIVSNLYHLTSFVNSSIANDILDVTDFGATGDGKTDDTAAIQSAINTAIATANAAGGKVYFPTGHYLISSQLSINNQFVGVILEGDGPTNSIILQSNASAHGIVFQAGSNVFNRGGGVRHLGIEAGTGYIIGGFQGTGSGGAGLVLQQIVAHGAFEDIEIHNFTYGVIMDGCWDCDLYNFEILYCASAGLYLNNNGSIAASAGNRFVNWLISNNGFSGVNACVGVQIFQSGGDYFRNIEIDGAAVGLSIVPATGKQVITLWFDTVLCDSSTFNGWNFDATNGKILSIVAMNCWGSFNGQDGILFQGTSSNFDAITFIGGRFRENIGRGIHFSAANNIRFIGGEVNANSRSQHNTLPGVAAEANIGNWSIIGMQIGNNASAYSDQADGIDIIAGTADNIAITGCDLRNFGSGKAPITNGATGTNLLINNNLPLSGTTIVPVLKVSTLPPAAADTGMRSMVSDAAVTTFATIVATSTSTSPTLNTVPVYSDGTNWRIG